jgi:tellurite resistance protein TehA-like permease
MSTPQSSSFIAHLSPAWGSAAMTLSGLAMASLLGPLPGSNLDIVVGLVILGFAFAAVATVSVLYGIKMVAHWSRFKEDLFNPGQGAQTAAWPASLLIAALATSQAGYAGYLPEEISFWVGSIVGSLGFIGTALSGFAFFSHVIGHPNIPAQAITAGWFVPVVPLVLVPSILLRLTALTGREPEAWVIWLGLSAWGVGFGLFLLLAAIIGGRLLMMEPPSVHALPSWWAWLAPLGAGGLGLVTSTSLLGDETLMSIAFWLAALIWGFSAWWVLFALFIIVSHRKEASFHLGYWGFGFPTAAFTTLSLQVGGHFGFPWLGTIATVFWSALLVLVLWLASKTVQAFRAGAFAPPK